MYQNSYLEGQNNCLVTFVHHATDTSLPASFQNEIFVTYATKLDRVLASERKHRE